MCGVAAIYAAEHWSVAIPLTNGSPSIRSILRSASKVNSANRVLNTNSPGVTSSDQAAFCLSAGAPHGNTAAFSIVLLLTLPMSSIAVG